MDLQLKCTKKKFLFGRQHYSHTIFQVMRNLVHKLSLFIHNIPFIDMLVVNIFADMKSHHSKLFKKDKWFFFSFQIRYVIFATISLVISCLTPLSLFARSVFIAVLTTSIFFESAYINLSIVKYSSNQHT